MPPHSVQAWAGEAACFFPRPRSPPRLACAAPRATGRGLWLRASTPARLRLDADSAELSLILQARVLSSARLRDGDRGGDGGGGGGGARALLLTPADTGTGAWLLLMLPAAAAAPGAPTRPIHCFRFHDDDDGLSFRARLDDLAARSADDAAAAAAAADAGAGADALVKAAIVEQLRDPAFAAYVERVERLFEEVEREAEAEAAGEAG